MSIAQRHHKHQPGVWQWALFISMYEYTLHFRWTEAHVIAGAFSRLPLPTASTEIPVPPELLMQHIDESTVTANQICAWTRREPTLDKVLQFIQQR